MIRSFWRRAMTMTLLAMLVSTTFAQAAPRETRIFCYLVYNFSNSKHKLFADSLAKSFKQLGFTDRMKRRGVVWREANFSTLGGVAQYLHISSDDIIYFGILMADSHDRITREMYRAHVGIPRTATDAQIRAIADNCANSFYFALADVEEAFRNKGEWATQRAIVDYQAQKAGQERLVIDGKDVTSNRTLLPQPPFKRQNIHVTMVPFSPALFKRLGATACGGTAREMWIKRGAKRFIIEVGPQLTDLKMYLVDYASGGDKEFMSPVKSDFAYPEIRGRQVFVPLALIVEQLGMPFKIESDDMKLTLTHR